MKQTRLLEFDGRGLLHGRLTLEQYLPGLDPGLVPLDTSQGLLADATLTALERAYGAAGSAAVLRQAGVLRSRPISQKEALKRLVARNTAMLPARLTSGVAPAGTWTGSMCGPHGSSTGVGRIRSTGAL